MKARSNAVFQQYKVDKILDEMPKDERASLEAALDDKGVPHIAIADVLTKNGYQCSAGAVRNYRQGKLKHEKNIRNSH